MIVPYASILMKGNLPSYRCQKRLKFTCMLSHINDSLTSSILTNPYPKDIQFVRCQTSTKTVLQLPFYLKGRAILQINTLKTYLSLIRNYAYLWLEGLPKDANLGHFFLISIKWRYLQVIWERVWVFLFLGKHVHLRYEGLSKNNNLQWTLG